MANEHKNDTHAIGCCSLNSMQMKAEALQIKREVKKDQKLLARFVLKDGGVLISKSK
jgi:hypothetical protein